ncbi:MAG: hypothetical protein R3A79_03525 [Nannocystaceae bacterium]
MRMVRVDAAGSGRTQVIVTSPRPVLTPVWVAPFMTQPVHDEPPPPPDSKWQLPPPPPS